MEKIAEVKLNTCEPVEVGSDDRRKMVVAKVPQGYDTKIYIRFVPGRDISFNTDVLGCQSRQGALRRDTVPVALPQSLIGKLKDANKKVIDWLAHDAVNAQLFLSRPVEALIKAGVGLTRSEQKTLDRTHRMVNEASVIAPGVKVSDLSALAYPKGRVGKPKPERQKPNGRDENCGCGPKGKEE